MIPASGYDNRSHLTQTAAPDSPGADWETICGVPLPEPLQTSVGAGRQECIRVTRCYEDLDGNRATKVVFSISAGKVQYVLDKMRIR